MLGTLNGVREVENELVDLSKSPCIFGIQLNIDIREKGVKLTSALSVVKLAL